MKCIEAQQLIQPYLNGELPGKTMEAFLDHVETCRDCYEELELFLTVKNTLDDSVPGDDFRFSGLKEHIALSRAELHRRKIERMAVAVLFVLFIGLAGALLYVLLDGNAGSKGDGNVTEAVTETVSEAVEERITESISETAGGDITAIISETEGQNASDDVAEGNDEHE